MNKRIIDGMSAQEIATGWDYSQEDILDYLESLCKPEPSWKDDICIALEKLKNGYPDKEYWERERWSYNRAIDDVIQVVKNH